MGLLDKTARTEVKKGPIRTRLDSIYEEVKKSKKLSLAQIAQKYTVSEDQAESWVKLLESQGLVELSYPPVGGIVVNAISNDAITKDAGWNKKTKLIVFACAATVLTVVLVYVLVKFLSDGGT